MDGPDISVGASKDVTNDNRPLPSPRALGMLIGPRHMLKALSRNGFFDEMHEFLPIKEKIDMSIVLGDRKGNCHSCSARREISKIENEFSEIASGLTEDRVLVLIEKMNIGKDMDVYVRSPSADGHGMTTKKIYGYAVAESAENKGNAMEEKMVDTSMMSKKPGMMLGGLHINKAISDPKFFSLMPEFVSIKVQIDTMHIDVKSKKGCSSCNKRRLHANIDGNFAAIVSRLPDDRAKVLKKYLGIEEDRPFFIRALNPATRQLILRQI